MRIAILNGIFQAREFIRFDVGTAPIESFTHTFNRLGGRGACTHRRDQVIEFEVGNYPVVNVTGQPSWPHSGSGRSSTELKVLPRHCSTTSLITAFHPSTRY
jgi:hypothetical protein